jgi:hypothetical protein
LTHACPHRGIGEECPKSTEYCFLENARPETYDEKMLELCKVCVEYAGWSCEL